MKHSGLLLFLMFSLWVNGLFAQIRYFDEVFSSVTVQSDITYGVNASILSLMGGEAVPQNLTMDVYAPEGDSVTKRPVVIIMHSGNFLPPEWNGGCEGSIFDPYIVELAMRLAKMGYVAAIADYRLGWNPISQTQDERSFTLINAIYRGVQDSRTCIRYFRKNVATNGNTFGIDPDKITLWGVGSGGYIALASATLDSITDTHLPKFMLGNNPMLVDSVNGNPDGTTVGIIPQDYPGWPFVGDTFCYPNHTGYSSRFGLAVNLSGALGDTSWLEPGTTPIISYHVPNDPIAPCYNYFIVVPGNFWLPVFEVMGSCSLQPISNAMGNANVWLNAGFNDPITQYVRSINGDIEGFFPFRLPASTTQPWAFADSPAPYGVPGSNCDTNKTEATLYLDSILTYFAPRACAVFGLYDDCLITSSTNGILTVDANLRVSPNPADMMFQIQCDSHLTMQHIELVDISGRILRTYRDVNTSQYQVQRAGLAPGLYFARVTFKEGIATQKVVLR